VSVCELTLGLRSNSPVVSSRDVVSPYTSSELVASLVFQEILTPVLLVDSISVPGVMVGSTRSISQVRIVELLL
jgi:hypothetical protein